jgi:multiple sugar transport system ATP-binding protein
MVGQPVVIGVRPEGLADVALEPGVPADRVIEATVDLVESLGAELIVHVTVADPTGPGPEVASDAWRQVTARQGRAVARLGTRSRLSAGDVVKLAVDTSRLHLFDAETGASLRTAGAA